MNRLIIDKKTKIEIKNNQIIIENNKYPLRLIDFLILADNIEIDTKTISKLTSSDISILIYNKTFSFIHPISSKNGELKKKQYFALNKRLEIAKWIIKGKIESNFLDIKFNPEIIDKCTTIQEVLGVEGSYSKLYFSKYFELFPKNLTLKKRTKNPPQDVVNALMSYFYTIAYYEITNLLIKNGFEPLIGYLHEPFRNHYALSSDLLEFFRSKIDESVYMLFKEKIVKKRDFTKEYRLRDEKRKEIWWYIKETMQDLKIQEKISELRSLL
ncbi:CRISPR-associated endonuclease Cas1 [Caminibacter pacificus]